MHDNNLEIPPFLRCAAEAEMPEEQPQADIEEKSDQPVTLDEIMERLKKLKEQRDRINEAIAAHKRVAKKLIQEM